MNVICTGNTQITVITISLSLMMENCHVERVIFNCLDEKNYHLYLIQFKNCFLLFGIWMILKFYSSIEQQY